MIDYLTAALGILSLVNISIWPPLIYFQNREIIRVVNLLIVTVSPDPDPGADEEPAAEPSNVVAIGRKAA